MSDDSIVIYEIAAPGVARLTINRPRVRNAQNLAVLHSLDDQFTRAMREEEVRVIIVAAEGPDFSAGHDLRHGLGDEDVERFGYRSSDGNFSAPSGAGYLAREDETYLQLSRRWRNLTKPTIAQVHGRCAGGTDPGLGVRPHHRQQGCDICRSRSCLGRLRDGVFRLPLGIWSAKGERIPVHRRHLDGAVGVASWDGKPSSCAA